MNAIGAWNDHAAAAPTATTAAMVRIDGTDTVFACRPQDTVLTAALRAGIGLPYECSSGGCGSCKVDLIDGALDILRKDAPGLKPREWERGKRLACQTRAIGDCTIRFRQDASYVPALTPHRLQARLVDRRPLTHDLWEFAFVAPGDADFLPGQYALLELPGVDGARAYSMSNIANRGGRWEFQIKRVPSGRATGYLFDSLVIGETIGLEAPFSIAHLREDSPRNLICVAGGSGLAPMLSIVRGVFACPSLSGRRIQLFYGGREPADIVAPDHFKLPPGWNDRLTYVPVISEGKSDAADRWGGARGFVHQAIADTLRDAAANEYYIAGPPPMVEAVRRMLVLEKSVPIEQVHYDRFF